MPTKRSNTSFSVKRKQINFNLLDTPVSNNSSSSSFHHHLHDPNNINSINQDIYDQLIKEKDERIAQLKKELNNVNQELQITRHQHRLMANEQSEFESTIAEKCSKEKQVVELELRILKDAHVEKVQSLSSSLNQLAGTVASLRDQLKRNHIKEEESQDVDALLLAESNLYKKDASFIKDAYHQVKGETHINHPLWSNIQHTTLAIKHEIDHFEAWKSIPIADLARLLREDQQKNNSVKSLLFKRYKGK